MSQLLSYIYVLTVSYIYISTVSLANYLYLNCIFSWSFYFTPVTMLIFNSSKGDVHYDGDSLNFDCQIFTSRLCLWLVFLLHAIDYVDI